MLFEKRNSLAMTHCPGLTASIVGAGAFHDSVRNGKRWFHTAPITKEFLPSKDTNSHEYAYSPCYSDTFACEIDS